LECGEKICGALLECEVSHTPYGEKPRKAGCGTATTVTAEVGGEGERKWLGLK